MRRLMLLLVAVAIVALATPASADTDLSEIEDLGDHDGPMDTEPSSAQPLPPSTSPRPQLRSLAYIDPALGRIDRYSRCGTPATSRRCGKARPNVGSGTLGYAGTVELSYPSAAVALVGFHESAHPGARPIRAISRLSPPSATMPSRNRGTHRHSAADIAIERGAEIRSPVTGTVLRAQGYKLYCRYTDHYVAIQPDGAPGWEVKILHINGVSVSPGDRVQAGTTRIAPSARILPFTSQIDRYTSKPPPGHIHLEVVDTSIPRRPSSGC